MDRQRCNHGGICRHVLCFDDDRYCTITTRVGKPFVGALTSAHCLLKCLKGNCFACRFNTDFAVVAYETCKLIEKCELICNTHCCINCVKLKNVHFGKFFANFSVAVKRLLLIVSLVLEVKC